MGGRAGKCRNASSYVSAVCKKRDGVGMFSGDDGCVGASDGRRVCVVNRVGIRPFITTAVVRNERLTFSEIVSHMSITTAIEI